MKTKLERLKEEIIRIENMQRKCNHEWNEPFEDVMQEPIYEDSYVGVDWYPKLVGYKNVPCWVRICKKCEKKETTKEMEEVPVKTELRPKFK